MFLPDCVYARDILYKRVSMFPMWSASIYFWKVPQSYAPRRYQNPLSRVLRKKKREIIKVKMKYYPASLLRVENSWILLTHGKRANEATRLIPICHK